MNRGRAGLSPPGNTTSSATTSSEPYSQAAFESVFDFNITGNPEAARNIIRQYVECRRNGLEPPAELGDYIHERLARIAEGHSADEVFGLLHGPGGQVTLSSIRRDFAIARLVWHRWKHDKMRVSDALEEVGIEVGLSTSRVRDIWYGRSKKKAHQKSGPWPRNWSKSFRQNAETLKRGYISEPGDLSDSFRAHIESMLNSPPPPAGSSD